MKIEPLGENTVIVTFSGAVPDELNSKAIELCKALDRTPFPGYTESAPAYTSAAVYFDCSVVRNAYPTFGSAFQAVSDIIRNISAGIADIPTRQGRNMEIGLLCGDEYSPDLEAASAIAGLDADSFINIFIGRTYRVNMLGFLPGFAYMSEVDERIAVPRRLNPRTNVRRGSVGIAGHQTGIYPLDSPGGWQIIGWTDSVMFDPMREEPCLLRPGDKVRFILR